MESIKIYSRPIIVIAITIVLSTLFFTFTAIEVHSESDVKYRQQSLFNDAGLKAMKQTMKFDSNNFDIAPFEMSFEVDKITPTPTPVINPATDDIWIKIAECESRQNWSINTGNGYYGGLQFSEGAWASVGGTGKPSDFSREEQIMRGKMLQAKRGWGPWGACSKKLGLN